MGLLGCEPLSWGDDQDTHSLCAESWDVPQPELPNWCVPESPGSAFPKTESGVAAVLTGPWAGFRCRRGINPSSVGCSFGPRVVCSLLASPPHVPSLSCRSLSGHTGLVSFFHKPRVFLPPGFGLKGYSRRCLRGRLLQITQVWNLLFKRLS